METEEKTTTKKRAKIIVSSEDELTDILRKVSSLDDENILLTFAEESDLLISPINLKVLQEVCDELDKNLILQIIQNPNGIRNAKIADSVTTNSPSEIDEALWLAAENQKRERKEALEKTLKGKPKETKEAIQNLTQEEPFLQDSEYQKRVQEVISKAKNLANKEQHQVVQEGDFVFAVGEEINPEEKKQEQKASAFIGKNFNNMGELKGIKGDIDKSIPENKKVERKIKAPLDKKKLKKKLILFSAIALVSMAVAGVFAYFTLPLVQAEIYIESRAIEVEKVFKGNTDTKNFSISEGEIPIRREEVKVDRSDDRETTGTGRRGTKAEGIVDIKYVDGDSLEIPAGTKITSEDLQFELSTDALIAEGPNTTQGIAVRAVEPGPEYNISSGQRFSIEGYPDDQNIWAENKSSFSGGASEEFSQLTQQDFDKLLAELKEQAFEEGEKQLEELLADWELIESTIEQSIEGNVRTDIPVGGEGSIFTMSIETKTEALFFKESDILNSREDIIKQAAIENNLFDSDDDLNLELDPEIETEITIEEIDENNVTIKFKAKGNVRPRVETEDIEKSLLGKSWEEGLKILEDIKYSEEEAFVKFSPEYFPEFLKHFPSREGRVIVETKLIETEVVKESEVVENEEEVEED
jgi:hypothetical protein